jgi:hypothetical protein
MPFRLQTYTVLKIKERYMLCSVNNLPYLCGTTYICIVEELISSQFSPQDPKDTPAPVKGETRDERQERKRKEKAEQMAYKLEQEIALCNHQIFCFYTSDLNFPFI